MHQNSQKIRIESVKTQHIIGRVAVPEQCRMQVFARIGRYEKKRLLRAQITNGTLGTSTFILSVYAGSVLWSTLSFSNGAEYISLAASDVNTLLSVWKEVGLIFLESIPVFVLLVLFVGVSGFVLSLVRVFGARPRVLFM